MAATQPHEKESQLISPLAFSREINVFELKDHFLVFTQGSDESLTIILAMEISNKTIADNGSFVIFCKFGNMNQNNDCFSINNNLSSFCMVDE